MSFDREKILAKCRKLLAFSEKRGATPNEVATAAGLLKRMLDKYQLSMADVAAGLREDGMAEVTVFEARRKSQLDIDIYRTLADAFDCELLVVTWRTGGRITHYTYDFVGCASDVAVAEYFAKQFRRHIGEGIEAYLRGRKSRSLSVRNGFWLGAVRMVYARLEELYADDAPAAPSAAQHGALVVVKAAMVQAWRKDNNIGAGRPSRGGMPVDAHAMRAGREAGAAMPLREGIAP